jgi:hypothetical protein
MYLVTWPAAPIGAGILSGPSLSRGMGPWCLNRVYPGLPWSGLGLDHAASGSNPSGIVSGKSSIRSATPIRPLARKPTERPRAPIQSE